MAVETVRLRPYGAALKDTWTHFPAGGEASARTNKEKTSAETPGTTEGVEATANEKKVEVKAGVSAAAYKLPAGAKCVGFKLWVYAKAGTAEKDVSVSGLPGAAAGVTLTLEETAFGWHSAALTKAAAEALTKTNLEEATLLAATKKATGAADQLVEWHIELEVETASTVVTGKATGTLLLTGTATAIVRSVVSGKATGPLLLTGTATATVRNVVTGKAAGALLLAGTATGTIRAVVAGKATGTLLLTGLSTGVLRSVVAAKATGTLILTGTAKASVANNVTGKAAGVLLLTGTSRAFKPAGVATKRTLILILED